MFRSPPNSQIHPTFLFLSLLTLCVPLSLSLSTSPFLPLHLHLSLSPQGQSVLPLYIWMCGLPLEQSRFPGDDRILLEKADLSFPAGNSCQ